MGYNERVNCLFLYNPNSGKGKIARKTDFIRKKLSKTFDSVDMIATASGEDMTERARDGAKHYDAILFSGGDGTFNRVLQGIGEQDVQLGYIPMGTANDVARSLKIPRSVRGALKVVAEGRSERIDCLRVGDRYAMYVAAAGTITSLTYETPQNIKRRLGRIGYAVHGLKKNMHFRVYPFACTCGEDRLETDGVLIFAVNGRSVAGFPVNRSASMQDGVMELAVIKQAKHPNFFQKLGAFFSIAAFLFVGMKVKKKDIVKMRGSRVLIETDPDLVWDLDGEEGPRGNVEIEVLAGHVKLFVPAKAKI